ETRPALYSCDGPEWPATGLAPVGFDSATDATPTDQPIASAPATLAAATAPHARAPPLRIACHAQSANAIRSKAAPSLATASLSSCAPSTHRSHSTVAYSGKASNCRSLIIHAPAFGSLALQRGKKASAT